MNEVITTRILAPHINLSSRIACYIVHHSSRVSKKNCPWTIMPDGCGYVILHVYEDWTDSRLILVGPRSIYYDVNRKDRFMSIIVKFVPGTIAPLLPFPADELKDQSILLTDLWPDLKEDTLGKLYQSGRQLKVDATIALLEQLLISKLQPSYRTPRNTLDKAIELIYQSQGICRISPLADRLGISERHLRNLFNLNVGLSPKRLARIVRVTEVIRRVDDGSMENWTDLAYQASYYDQSHLIDDFNLLLGESPEKFIGRPNREEII